MFCNRRPFVFADARREVVSSFADPRIGRGKPGPQTAAASRRTPHGAGRPDARRMVTCRQAVCRAWHAMPLRRNVKGGEGAVAPTSRWRFCWPAEHVCRAQCRGGRPYREHVADAAAFGGVTRCWLQAAVHWYDWRLGTQPERLLVNPKRESFRNEGSLVRRLLVFCAVMVVVFATFAAVRQQFAWPRSQLRVGRATFRSEGFPCSWDRAAR